MQKTKEQQEPSRPEVSRPTLSDSDARTWERHAPIVISLVSVALAIAALLHTFTVTQKQSAQWILVNAPQVALSQASLTTFREVDEQAALEAEWGYQPILHRSAREGRFVGGFDMLSEPALWDRARGAPITGHLPVMTIAEAIAEGERLGLARFEVWKRIQPHFVYENRGSTVARNVRYRGGLVESDDSVVWLSDVRWGALFPGETLSVSHPIVIPLDADLVDLRIEALFQYDFVGSRHTERRRLRYDPVSNGWSLEPLTEPTE